MLKEHEKLLAFLSLGFALLLIAMTVVVHPIQVEGVQRTIDACVGAFSLALGVAANALFRVRDESEKTVKIEQPAGQPVPVSEVPTTSSSEDIGELKPEERLDVKPL